MEGDGYPHALPEDPVLAEAARALEDGRLAGELLDAEWRVCYVSGELRKLTGFDDDGELGYGMISFVRAAAAPEVWRLSDRSARAWWTLEGPFMRHDLGAAEGRVAAALGSLVGVYDDLEPAEPPIAWAGSFVTSFADASAVNVGRLVVRLARADGNLAGILSLYVGGGQRGSVQAMLSRGDDRMFERMAALTEPARRPAAIEATGRIQGVVDSIRLERGPVRVNIGIHWGGTLVIGQVVTGGRLEVTALGDEVNQAAWIQEVCRGGRTLVSKDVIERLDSESAAALGIDPEAISYEILGEIDGAGEMARRDAGGLAVAALTGSVADGA